MALLIFPKYRSYQSCWENSILAFGWKQGGTFFKWLVYKKNYFSMRGIAKIIKLSVKVSESHEEWITNLMGGSVNNLAFTQCCLVTDFKIIVESL